MKTKTNRTWFSMWNQHEINSFWWSCFNAHSSCSKSSFCSGKYLTIILSHINFKHAQKVILSSMVLKHSINNIYPSQNSWGHWFLFILSEIIMKDQLAENFYWWWRTCVKKLHQLLQAFLADMYMVIHKLGQTVVYKFNKTAAWPLNETIMIGDQH